MYVVVPLAMMKIILVMFFAFLALCFEILAIFARVLVGPLKTSKSKRILKEEVMVRLHHYDVCCQQALVQLSEVVPKKTSPGVDDIMALSSGVSSPPPVHMSLDKMPKHQKGANGAVLSRRGPRARQSTATSESPSTSGTVSVISPVNNIYDSSDGAVEKTSQVPLGPSKVSNLNLEYNGGQQKRKITFRSGRKKPLAMPLSPEDIQYISNVEKALEKILGSGNCSLCPVILRLAWHCCASYDKYSGTGGSNGSASRINTEIASVKNTGLESARDALEPIKQKFPRISYADLWTLAGKKAVEAMGGPTIPWKCGRSDLSARKVVMSRNLPFGYKRTSHVRGLFERLSLSDNEAVALCGSHVFGNCHSHVSGWNGQWSTHPHSFSNEYFRILLDSNWKECRVPETGRTQYSNESSLVSLGTDMELLRDESYKQYVVMYAHAEKEFTAAYASAFSRLLELGISRDAQGKILQ